MSGFGLQFLNGIGEAYDKPTQDYADLENKSITEEAHNVSFNKGNNMNEEINEVPASDGRCYCNCTKEDCVKSNKMVKYALVFAVGAIAGQWIKKIFKD